MTFLAEILKASSVVSFGRASRAMFDFDALESLKLADEQSYAPQTGSGSESTHNLRLEAV